MDKRKLPESKNFVDLSGLTGEGFQKLRALNNFLNAFLLNRRSSPGPDMGQNEPGGWVQLPEDVKYELRPVETPSGNMVSNILTSPKIGRNEMFSAADKSSPAYEDFFYNYKYGRNKIQAGSKTDKIKKRYK
jgi:hypothetical protein